MFAFPGWRLYFIAVSVLLAFENLFAQSWPSELRFSDLPPLSQRELGRVLNNLDAIKETANWANPRSRSSLKESFSQRRREDETYSKWFFEQLLSDDERRVLVCLESKLEAEQLWSEIDRIIGVTNGGDLFFVPYRSNEEFRRFLEHEQPVGRSYGTWWFAKSTGFRWGLRSERSGAQLHFREHRSGIINVHIDLHNPGVEIPILSFLFPLAPLRHYDLDFKNRNQTHRPREICGAMAKAGFSLPFEP